MAYAELAAVTRRAGVLSGAWGDNTDVSTQDVQEMLEEVAGDIDAVLSGLGFAVPVTNEVAARSLANLNADGALLIALEATFPETESNRAASAMLADVRSRYEDGMKALAAKTYPAVVALTEATTGSASPEASSLWDDPPQWPEPCPEEFVTSPRWWRPPRSRPAFERDERY